MRYISLLLCFLPYPGFAQQDSISKPVDSFICVLHETQAVFPGGPKVLEQFIRKNTYFPKGTEGIQGKVLLRFDILKDGSVKNIVVLRSLLPELDHIAVEMVRKMPPWRPATLLNKPVDCKYLLPVKFIAE